MPFHDKGLLFLTTSLVIQIYDLEHDFRCERHTVFALKCFRRHMLLEICSKCEILLKCCPKCGKVLKGAQNAKYSAPNSKKCSKGAQRNRERPKGDIRLKKKDLENYWELVSFLKEKKRNIVFLWKHKLLTLQFLE